MISKTRWTLKLDHSCHLLSCLATCNCSYSSEVTQNSLLIWCHNMLLARAVISLSTISSRSWLFTSIRRTASTERSRSLPFSPNQHADELREWLRDTGAMDAEWPVKIRAEPLHRKSVTHGDAKIVHFQRHGQGYHNLIYTILGERGSPVENIYESDANKNPFLRPEITDSPLTSLGRDQCLEKRGLAASLSPELVVVSPLHRAMQTAQLTFGDFSGKVPFVAHDLCREELGLLVCNKRRPLSETAREFPYVDFSLISAEEDNLWDPKGRESPVDKSQRVYKFLSEFIRNREEKEIVIVGHSAWFFNMMNTVVDCGHNSELSSWFGTSEIRSVVLSFSQSDTTNQSGNNQNNNASKK